MAKCPRRAIFLRVLVDLQILIFVKSLSPLPETRRSGGMSGKNKPLPEQPPAIGKTISRLVYYEPVWVVDQNLSRNSLAGPQSAQNRKTLGTSHATEWCNFMTVQANKKIFKLLFCMSFSIELLNFYYILQKYESTMDWGKNWSLRSTVLS